MTTEIVCNLHIHTPYSDGELYHDDLAAAAARAGVDVLFVTDHNVLVRGVDGWRDHGGHRVLVLAGEEIHHQDRQPQKNHLLVFGAGKELSTLAENPQELLDAVKAEGGEAFIAHPFDPDSDFIGEESLGWVSWDVRGYAGIELWNYMSEFKGLAQNLPAALFYAYLPSLGIRGPDPRTLELWDRLLASGQRVASLGGSDSHGHSYSMGPLQKVIFPYEYLFRAVNTHLLLPSPLSGDAGADRRRIVECLAAGCGWVAYDLLAGSRGTRIHMQGTDGSMALPGGEIPAASRPFLHAEFPGRAEIRIVRAGGGVVWKGGAEHVRFPVEEQGVYRLEAWRWYRGALRGWIFSNPFYVV